MNPSLAVVVCLALASGCRRTPPPVPTTVTPGQSLHIEGVPGVANVDIHALPDGGGTHIQIGGARVDLPSNDPTPIPDENTH